MTELPTDHRPLTTGHYDLYSDVSIRGRNCGWAWLVSFGNVVSLCCTGVTFERHAHPGELWATLHGLRRVPRGRPVIVHSDVSQIERWLDGRNKFGAKLREPIRLLRKAIDHRGDVTVQYDMPHDRSEFYHRCHVAARAARVHFEKHRVIKPNAFSTHETTKATESTKESVTWGMKTGRLGQLFISPGAELPTEPKIWQPLGWVENADLSPSAFSSEANYSNTSTTRGTPDLAAMQAAIDQMRKFKQAQDDVFRDIVSALGVPSRLFNVPDVTFTPPDPTPFRLHFDYGPVMMPSPSLLTSCDIGFSGPSTLVRRQGHCFGHLKLRIGKHVQTAHAEALVRSVATAAKLLSIDGPLTIKCHRRLGPIERNGYTLGRFKYSPTSRRIRPGIDIYHNRAVEGILFTLCHELAHYEQWRDERPVKEDGVNERAVAMLQQFREYEAAHANMAEVPGER